jgi:hypothetical protein
MIGTARVDASSHFALPASLHGMMSEGEGTLSKADLIQEIRRLPFAEKVELLALEELWNEVESDGPELLEWQKELWISV